MSNFYIRVKGRVQGPFDVAKLRSMAQRGQLSRIHQVSEDGEIWKKASEYPEFFLSRSEVASSSKNISAASAEAAIPEPEIASPQPEVAAAPSTANWFVELNGESKGPFPFGELQAMFRSGQCEPTRLVWREGMADWVTADSIDGLVPMPAVNVRQQSESKQRDVSSETISLLMNSRSWVLFISIVSFVFAALAITSAFIVMVQGARMQSDAVVSQSIVTFLVSGLIACFGAFLLSYSYSMLNVQIARSERSLNNALRKLNRIWLFVGIVLIVWITFLVIFIVLTIAVFESAPNYLFPQSTP